MNKAPEQRISIKPIDLLILAVKASGGYKYRAMMQMQDGQELDSFIANAEARLRFIAHSLEVAEAMLREPPPSMWHSRWEEYQERLAELRTRHQAVAKSRDGPAASLGVAKGNRTNELPESADEPGGNIPA